MPPEIVSATLLGEWLALWDEAETARQRRAARARNAAQPAQDTDTADDLGLPTPWTC